MFFLVDSDEHTVTAHKTRGYACRIVLDKLGIITPRGENPVTLAWQAVEQGNRFKILNLSAAFEEVSLNPPLAPLFRQAVDEYYQ